MMKYRFEMMNGDSHFSADESCECWSNFFLLHLVKVSNLHFDPLL